MGWAKKKIVRPINKKIITPIKNKIIKPIVGAIDFVIDKIIEPVVETAGNIIDSALDDPIKTIAMAVAYVYAPHLIPLIEGVAVAADGGDLGDILEATAKAYVVQEIGSRVATSVSGSVTANQAGVAAGVQTANEAIVANVIGRATGSAAVAVVTKQDPLKAFIAGGVSAGVPALLGKVDGFTKLPKSAQQAISQAVTAKALGRKIDATAIAGMVAATEITTRVMEAYDPKGTKLTATEHAFAADMLMATTSAAIQGGDVSKAIQTQLIKAGTKQLGKMVESGFKDAVAKITNTYESADANGMVITKNEADQKIAIDKYNAEKAKLQVKIDKQDQLKADAEAKVAIAKKDPENEAKVNAANAATKTYADYAKTVAAAYTKAKPILDGYSDDVTKLQVTHAEMTDDYEDLIKALAKSTKPVRDQLDTTYSATNESFVEVLDPKFNAAQYKKINGLGADADAYEHYLSEGMVKGLKTNDAAAQGDFMSEKVRLLVDLAGEKGINPSQISDTDVQNFMRAVDRQYKGNLTTLKSASIKDMLTGNTKSYDDLLKDSSSKDFRVDVKGQSYGDWRKPKGYTPPAGTRLATVAELDSGGAVQSYTDDGKPVWITEDKGVQVWDPSVGDYVYKTPTVLVTATKMSDLLADDPEAALILASQFDEPVVGGAFEDLYKFAKATTDLAKATDSPMLMNAAGNAYKAGGGILEAFNNLVVLAGVVPDDTALGKFASKLVKLGEATTTADYQAAIADVQKTIGEGKGVLGTAKAIYGAFKNHPVEFLAEYVGVNGMQELVPLLIGGGATKFATGLALAKGMGVKAAQKFGVSAGLKTAAVSDIAESVGGTAGGAYKEAYDAARKSGMGEADATQAALDIAARAGLVSGVVTALSLGVGGAALEKAFFGKKQATGELASVFDAIKGKMVNGVKITSKEGVAEGIEEGLVQAFTEGQLYKLDPTRDVLGNITASAILGTITGGGIAGTTMAGKYTGDFVSNVLVSNPQVGEIIGTAPKTAAGAQGAMDALKNLGITNSSTLTDVANNVYDAGYTNRQEAIAAFNQRSDYQFSDTDIDATIGATLDKNLEATVSKYIDPKVFDVSEIKAIALAEGITLTDTQAQEYVGQGSEAALAKALSKKLDPTATTFDEAKTFLTDLGYKPTNAEVQQFVAANTEKVQSKAIAEYVNPRITSFDEAKKFLADAGYSPTDAEVKKFVGQYNESVQQEAIRKYADPRVVDKGEARAAYEALGIKKPTEADIKALMGQYAESDLAGKAEGNLDNARYNSIMAQLDDLTVGASQETLDAIALVKSDLTKQVTNLGFKIDETAKNLTGAIGDVETNVLSKIAENEAAGLTRDEALNKAIADVAADLGTTREDVLNKIGATEATLGTRIDTLEESVSTQITDLSTDVQTKYDALTDEQKAIADQLTQQGVDLNTAIDTATTQLSTQITDLSTDVQTKYDALTNEQKALADQLTQQGVDLNTAIDTAKTELSTQITDLSTDVQTKYDALTNEQKALADQLTQQGVDLNTAIDTAKTEFTTALGETETRVTSEIQAVADLVGKPAREVTQADVDYVSQFLQDQQTNPNLEADLNYDYNADSVVDINDQTALDAVLKGTTEPPLDGSPFAATGVYKTLATNQAAQQKAIADEAERTRQANAASALRTQRMGNVNSMMGMLGQSNDIGGQQVTVKPSDPAKIGYMYDFESIFANPTQEKMFTSPYGSYAKGGMVEDDVNAELIKMLRS